MARKNEKLARFWHVGTQARWHVNHAGTQARDVDHVGMQAHMVRDLANSFPDMPIYSSYQPRKNERLSRPWSHPVVLNTRPLGLKSPQRLCGSSCTWVHVVQLHIAGTYEPNTTHRP